MIINNVGYNHCHDADFFIDRPLGSGDNLLLILRTDAIFTIDGVDILVPANSFFMYKKGRPQYYRCVPSHVFANDWIHFDFEDNEEDYFLSLGLKYESFVHMDNVCFFNYCIKSIAYEAYSSNIHRSSTIKFFMFLMFNKISECNIITNFNKNDTYYEMLSTIRNKIYSHPYEKRTIDSTAHEVRMSKSNFQQLYKKYFNITFMQDLINSRIQYAQMLLLNTNLSSADVSKHCGYNYYAHFERQFKQKTGLTPFQFRNIKKSDNFHD